jgi:hypothetical protein
MARGWESKDIESQIEDAQFARAPRSEKPGPTQEQKQLRRELETLQLSRTRVLADLETAQNAGYREMLTRSLNYLDEKIAAITSVP